MIEGSLRLFGYGLGLFLFGEGRERRTPEGEDIGSGKDFVVGIQLGFREMAYTQIIRFIKEKKPYIHTTLENTTPENAVQAKAYIQKLYDTCQIK